MGILLTDGRQAMPYTYQPYPKFLEHPDGRTCVVASLEAHRDAVAEGWPAPEGDAPRPALQHDELAEAFDQVVKPKRGRKAAK